MYLRLLGSFTCCAMLAFASGCGGSYPTAPLAKPHLVRGRIQFADKTPLKGGVVYFTPLEVNVGTQLRYEAASLVDAQGNYKLGFNGDNTGAVPGEYKVWFTPREYQELAGSNSARIPEPYLSPKTTPLTTTVRDGENVIDLTMR